MTHPLVVTPVEGLPEVREGDDLAALIVQGLARSGVDLRDGDVLVVSSKVVSKAAGLTAVGGEGAPGGTGARDAAIAGESFRVVAERISPIGLTQVVETFAGPVMAAAGVDASNTGAADVLLLLPRDPDEAAAELRAGIQARWSAAAGAPISVGIVLSDTAGRPWRVGQTDFALGASGLRVSENLRGSVDADGRSLRVTERCLADEIAAAADLVKGKADGIPVAHLRGVPDGTVLSSAQPGDSPAGARSLVRTGPEDWFGLGRAEAVRSALGVEPGSALAHAVGIASTVPESTYQRVRRAVAVATTGLEHTSTELGPDGTVALAAPDGYAVGFAAARLVVALAGEGLASTVSASRPSGRGRAGVVVTPRTAPPGGG